MSDQPSPRSSPSPHQPIPTPVLSPSEAARLELQAILRAPSPDEEDVEQDGNVNMGSQAGSNDQVSQTQSEHGNGATATSSQPLVLSLRNELAHAKRRAVHYKLAPYQKDLTNDFVKMMSLAREVELFVALCALDTKVQSIVIAAPPFSISAPLLENIKSYSMAVLLSSKTIIKQRNLHLPNNFLVDHHAQKELRTSVGYELTQARSAIKKEITPAIKAKTNIFELASKIVEDTQCLVTVPLCARIALLRKVHVEYTSGNTYWNNVDAHLQMVREEAKHNPKQIDKVLRSYLQTDRKSYGVDTGYVINEGDDDDLLISVDSIILGCIGSSAATAV
ncbi:hypothetical protein Hypma_008505 [Hypsizygus marmoreus]|uniref:Uncharacterized protein n=1 Tax=Hypsizygus marmoreus TaxID=39966 RepID=A0A369JQ40_HYPMA|nr:hypothetical protein Hypma_008505 [Hypsizygus marmoreus]